jgi:hypothetical protein
MLSNREAMASSPEIKANLGHIGGMVAHFERRYAIFHRLTFGLGKSERGVRRDGPNQVAAIAFASIHSTDSGRCP